MSSVIMFGRVSFRVTEVTTNRRRLECQLQMCPADHSNAATSQLHTTQRLVKISYDAMAPCQSPIAAANVGLLNPRRQLPHGNGGDCARKKTPHTAPPREQLNSPLDIKLAFDIVRRVQFLTGRPSTQYITVVIL